MEKTKIYIYGAGGHGLVVADCAIACGFKEIVFLDDKFGLKFSPNLVKAPIIIAIGENKTRQNLSDVVKKAGFNQISLIHPSAVVSPSAVIKSGVVIMPNAVINARAIINEGAIINSGAIIEHECVIGEFSHISPNAALAGRVNVGARTHIGMGANVIQCVNIGSDCTIGAGSVVLKDIANNSKAYGVPAKAYP